MTRKPSKIRIALQNLVLAVTACVVLFLMLEVVLRTTHLFGSRISWREPHPVLGWTGTPNFKYWSHKENDHAISGRLNSFGWRDVEWTVEKPQGSYRIAVLGDSFVEGMQVEHDSTFVVLAEKTLSQEAVRPIEIMNFGRQGMTQSEEYLVLQHDIVRFSPDMVVLVFWPSNDIREIHRSTARNELRPFYQVGEGGDLELDTGFNQSRGYKIKTTVRPFKQASAVVSLLGERYNALRLSRREKQAAQTEATQATMSGYLSLYTAQPDPTYVSNYALCKRLIVEMRDYCGERNIAFVLTTGTPVYETDDVASKRAVDATFNPDFFDRDLGAWAETKGIEFFGLHGPFEAYHQETGRSLNWAHWNYDGHRVVAQALVAKLETVLPDGVLGER